MRVPKGILISTLTGLTCLAPAQAEISRIDLKAADIKLTAPKASQSDIYIVQMKGDPVISYQGGVPGYSATMPRSGNKVDPDSSSVKRYVAYLERMQNRVVNSINAEKVYNYRYSLNGFAARMSGADAAALRKRSDVVNVWRDEIRQIQTDQSPTYIGLTENGQAWSQGVTGEDVVIGVIDTGIWPEHPSFADVPTPIRGNMGPSRPYDSIGGFLIGGFRSSSCDFGSADPMDDPFSCNNKLLAASCYNMGFSSGPDATNPCGGDGAFVAPWDFHSARDANSHGTHVASTAGGNYGVEAVIDGTPMGTVSGVAPRARVVAYKVCWEDGGDGGCAGSDSAAAIDQAVADGVDVINFSIGGPSTYLGGPDTMAFLNAANAGVYVATSNGNAGPGDATVGTPAAAPWITAVGATQDDGVLNSVVTINAPASVAGDVVAVEGAGDVLLADTGAITGDVTLTNPADGCAAVAPVTGIALTIRGGCSFTDKYNNAAAAGASAIIVYNDGTAPDRMDPIVMSAPGTTIPGVMIGFDDGDALANATGVNATMDPSNTVVADSRVAEFSSRGPNLGAPDIIKPDVSAPGVDILAGATPANGGELFAHLNGTSMASPHVAGAFALLKQRHGDWSPAVARSALMTTARQGLKKTFGEDEATPFDVGAGEILPTDANEPGLAYDAGWKDYLAFTCGTDLGLVPDGACSLWKGLGLGVDASNLNLPSIGIGELVGTQMISRTVTAVSRYWGRKTFNVTVDAPEGVDVSVIPSTINLAYGQSKNISVMFTVNSGANMGEWAFGSLTWTDTGGQYSVRSPIAVRPVALTAPVEVDGVADGTGAGSVDVPVMFGYEGPYSASVSGLYPGLSAGANITAGDGYHAYCIDLPANTHFRTALFDEDTSSPGNDDLDLQLYYAPGGCAVFDIGLVGSSGGLTSEEVIDITNGPAGGYVPVVWYYAAANGNDSNYRLWLQPVFGDEGNTIVTAPAAATAGDSATVTVDYTGLVPTRNLGVLHHQDNGGEVARTILDIDAR